jgi:hypothetical protein
MPDFVSFDAYSVYCHEQRYLIIERQKNFRICVTWVAGTQCIDGWTDKVFGSQYICDYMREHKDGELLVRKMCGQVRFFTTDSATENIIARVVAAIQQKEQELRNEVQFRLNHGLPLYD